MRASLLLLLAVACGRSGDGDRGGAAEHPRDAELRRLIARSLDLHDALVTGAKEAGGDCAVMAQRLTAAIDAHRDALDLTALEADPALRARADQLVGEQGERIAAWAVRFGEATRPCVADPRVGAALSPLEAHDLLRAD